MAKKQIHWAVYVEVDTETGEVGTPKVEGEGLVGSPDGYVYDVETEEWESGFGLPDSLYDAAWQALSDRLTEVEQNA